jgi:hemoglobin
MGSGFGEASHGTEEAALVSRRDGKEALRAARRMAGRVGMNEEAIWGELGAEGFAAVVAGFYRRVRSDNLLGPMYPADDWEGSERRLWQFLCFRIGGDPSYMEERGHPRLRMRHVPFAIGIAERDRWLALMDAAMEESGVTPETREPLRAFFTQVADFMRNVPEA